MSATAPPGYGLTILRTTSKGALATKRHQWNAHQQRWEKHSYQAGARFHAEEATFADLDELAARLEQVRRDPRAFIVRGALTKATRAALADEPGRPIRRRKHGAEPELQEVSRAWMMADIDAWPLPAWADLVDDPEQVVEAAVQALLPPAFHDVRAFFQLSASAGFVSDVLKAHIFFTLAEPASNETIKAVLQHYAPGVDRAPFNATQPHFVADPLIVGGHDPLPRRTGWVQGTEEEVVLPAVPVRQAGQPVTIGRLPPGGVNEALGRLGDGEGLDGFHAPLRGATMRYARQSVRSGARDDAALVQKLRAAILAAPRRSDRDLEAYRTGPELQRLIDGAFSRVRSGDSDILAVPPYYAAPTLEIEACRAETRRLVAASFQELRKHNAHQEGDPPHLALAVDVAIGKTSAAREQLTHHIVTCRSAQLPHRVLWLVPFPPAQQ